MKKIKKISLDQEISLDPNKKYTIKFNKQFELTINPTGFTLWVKEEDGQRHWILDASRFTIDNIMRYGNLEAYPYKTDLKLFPSNTFYKSELRIVKKD